MLVSACRNIANKTITKHASDKDGINAWEELRRDFDNDGSKTLRLEVLEETVGTRYDPNQTGGLAAYLDKFLQLFMNWRSYVENHTLMGKRSAP
jgi:hypothetical protein